MTALRPQRRSASFFSRPSLPEAGQYVANAGRIAVGAVFLALFIGLELHISAIENLLPGSYGGFSTTNYLGFGFLISGITSLASGFSGPSPRAAAPDPTMMAAMMASMQQAQAGRMPPTAPVKCPGCGASNLAGAKFCSSCAQPLPATAPATA